MSPRPQTPLFRRKQPPTQPVVLLRQEEWFRAKVAELGHALQQVPAERHAVIEWQLKKAKQGSKNRNFTPEQVANSELIETHNFACSQYRLVSAVRGYSSSKAVCGFGASLKGLAKVERICRSLLRERYFGGSGSAWASSAGCVGLTSTAILGAGISSLATG
jgi:hypothetical protein